MYSLSANLTVANDRITAEVQRASTAEAGKIDKTSQYQDASSIVTEAVSQSASSASGLYIAKTTTYQDAGSIVTEAVRQSASAASGLYIEKTTSYQDAGSIVSEAVRQSGVNAGNNFIAKTTSLQTADAIYTSAVNSAATSAANLYIKQTTNYKNVSSILGYADTKAAAAETAAKNASIAKTATYQDASAIVAAAGQYTDGRLTSYSTTTQTAQAIAAYVGENAYGKVSGITITASGVDISGSQYVKIASGGYFRVTSGNFGIKSDAGDTDYVIWSGASAAASSPFRVKKNGEVYLTKLIAVAENGTETEVNLRTAGLWKLNYHTIKNYTVTGGYCTAMTLSNGTTVNFNNAASARADGWGAAYSNVRWPSAEGGGSIKFRAPTGSESDTPNYAEREYSLTRDGQYIALRNGGITYASLMAYSRQPTWSHNMVTATVVSVSCTVDGYTYTTQFSI